MTRAEVPLLKGHTQQLHSPQPLHATLQASGERRAAGAGAGSLGTLGWRGVCVCLERWGCFCPLGKVKPDKYGRSRTEGK